MEQIIIGLTGPTGSGKSTAAAVAQELGFFVIDADKVAHRVTDQNLNCKSALVAEFGDILDHTGALNRKKLAAAAFKTPQATKRLNQITLPFIMEEIKGIIKRGGNKILLDAPTLFEAGAESLCHKVYGVLAPTELRLARIMKRDGIGEEAALLRINAGKNDEFYHSRCNKILLNGLSESEFKAECVKAFSELN